MALLQPDEPCSQAVFSVEEELEVEADATALTGMSW